jgi:hypothetical protein
MDRAPVVKRRRARLRRFGSALLDVQRRHSNDRLPSEGRPCMRRVFSAILTEIPMPSPCPKCGGMKIEPAESGLLYWLAGVFGYRLRVCGRCRGYRLLPARGERRSRSSRRGDGESEPAAEAGSAENAAPAKAEAATSPPGPAEGSESSGEEGQACPWCGSHDYRRSHRTWWERRRGSPPMYRCRQCDHRFPRAQD